MSYQSDGGTVFAASANNNAITVPLPATRPVGSVLLFIGWCRLITATVTTAPAGYTLLGTYTSATASGGRIWLYAKEVVGDETAPTFATTGATGTSGDLWGADIFCYDQVDLSGGISSILDGTPVAWDASGTTTCTYPALNITNADSMLVRFLVRFRDATDTFTPTATWNEREDLGSTIRTGGQFHLQDKDATASGTQAAVTVAPSNATAARYLSVTLALKRATSITYFGAFALPITFGKDVAGVRQALGELALPITFSATVVPVVPKSTTIPRISLGPGSTPESRTLHAINVRARVTGGAGKLRVALYEGATNRSGNLETALTGSLADYSLPISDVNAASIVNYNYLELRFWGYSETGDAITVEIDQIWLDVPPAAGAVTHYGISSMPVTFGKAVAGSRKTFSSLTDPITFGATVQGRRQSLGVVALPVTFSKAVAAQRKTFGQTLSPFIFGKAVAAQRKTFGQTAFPITVGIATAGQRASLTLFGTIALPVTFGKDVRGQRKAFGQIALPLTFGKDVRGVRKTFGQIVFPIIYSPGVIGRKNVFGQLSMQTLFGKEIAGKRRTFGQILVPIVFTKAVAGRKQTFGQIARPINFTAYVAGIGFVGATTHFGTTVFPITFGKAVAARRKTFGQITAPYIFGEFTQGKRKTFSKVDLDLDVMFAAFSGPVGVHGQVSLPIIFDVDVNGIVRPIAIILNLAEMIYLGSTPVVAVYTEDQQVWP